MEWLREISRWSHVIVGFAGLLAFWFPVFTRKGGRFHKLSGKIFVFAGYWVVGTAALSCTLIAWPAFRDGLTHERMVALAPVAFLTYLAWVTYVLLRYAVGVLRTKKDPTLLDTTEFRVLSVSAVISSPLLVIYATMFSSSWSVVLYALSPLGVLNGWPIWRYLRGKVAGKRVWFYEHLNATIGAGIAFHTAFAVFGSSRLFDNPLSGIAAVVPWVLPTAVGVPAMVLWKRHYQRKFGELPKPSDRIGADTLPTA
ncbi:MAG: hypothetical protein AAGD38_06005 [Acidobacteriota bacterium]